MATATPTDPGLRRALEAILAPERILTDPIARIAWASDASFYRLIPQAVAQPDSIAEVQALLRLARNRGIPIAVRAGGTSLSGQAITDGILVDVGRHWRRLEVIDGGARVRAQPGVIGATVNAALKPYAAKMGPDPASIASCMIGGIVANNSSGMCCGVVENAYHTLESLVFVLADGTCIDTAAHDADARFHALAPALASGLLALKRRLEADHALVARIRAKYRRKNTTGYALNALLDHGDAVSIFRHLLVGSEGTLAFIAEATLRTVPDLPAKRTAMLAFATIGDAARAIAPLTQAGAAAIEIMDRAALRSVETNKGAPDWIAALGDGAAALLVEFHGRDAVEVDARLERAGPLLMELAPLHPARFTADAYEQAALWKIRKGMFPSVGAVRARGTSVILEDVCFPVDRLAPAIGDLQDLFRRHHYHDAIIFGHAKDGNLHFVVSQAFSDSGEIERYHRFVSELVELVVERYDGALKAEHGTGRNMAPFVEAEWGPEAYAVMCELKRLADPDGVLNPGVVINRDPRAHLKDLKPLPVVEDEVDKCIECGFCEAKCPSRDVSLTPRQRIVVRRERARLVGSGEDPALLASLEGAYGWHALDTCATDGLCASACPVDIDTGKLVKRLRAEAHSPFAQRVALSLARSFAAVEGGARLGMAVARGAG
ncbi:MAG: FAD-binding oxidoreductase, partial [Planctomycetes bacterium]|nr:FAD-binding oxidoreductase [Planctomycetota bacterium]